MKRNDPMYEYFYGIGIIDKIRAGAVEKRILSKQGINFSKMLEETSHISTSIIGIYDKFIPGGKETPNQKEEFRRILLRSTDLAIKLNIGGSDPVYHNLIMVGYSSKKLEEEVVSAFLNDRFKRIAIYEAHTMPEPNKRDMTGLFKFMSDFSYELNVLLESHYRTEALMLAEKTESDIWSWLNKMKKHGLNRDDWVSLITMLPPLKIPKF